MLFVTGCLAWFSVAAAQEPDPRVRRAIDLMEELYLEPELVEAGALLRASVDRLAGDLHWLRVTSESNYLYLYHGDGSAIGTVSVADLDTLPDAIAVVQKLVVESGHDLAGIDVGLSLLKGLPDALDRHSRVLAGERLARFDERLRGTKVGIGASLSVVDNELVVRSLVDGGPADVGGLLTGDVLLRIDGKRTTNMPVREAIRLIQGDKGTVVQLEVGRAGDDASPVLVSLKRDVISLPNVTHRVLDSGLGYVSISHISQLTAQRLRGALDALKEEGGLETGLVLDVRDNTGGSMLASAHSVDPFVDDGLLLRTAGRDGGRVSNLQERIDARSGGRAADLPVVVLVNERTASGAEIIAGSLVEHNRAVVVGEVTYGKGTVQSVYQLGRDVKLKLTVARYLLENERAVTDMGLVPDEMIGQVDLDEGGVRFRGFESDQVPFVDIIPAVSEWSGWRGTRAGGEDVALEIAQRALLSPETGPQREQMLNALSEAARSVREEQEAHLAQALTGNQIDWSPAPVADRTLPEVDVQVESTTDRANSSIRVEITVRNVGTRPLHRVLVRTRCDSVNFWDGIVVPVGKITPGGVSTGTATLKLRPGVNTREDLVNLELRSDRRPVVQVEPVRLTAESPTRQRVAVDVSLKRDVAQSSAVVSVTNTSERPLNEVEVWFAYPGDDAPVELLDRASRTSTIEPSGSHEFVLDVAVDAAKAAESLPLRVMVEATESRRPLATWDVSLPIDGGTVHYEPPSIQAVNRPLVAPVGPFDLVVRAEDDRRVDHIVVFHDGQKVGWGAGTSEQLVVSSSTTLAPGVNRFRVYARDDQQLRDSQQFVVYGVEPPATAVAPSKEDAAGSQ